MLKSDTNKNLNENPIKKNKFDSNKIKKDFPIFKDNKLVYLDNGASTQKPKQVIQSITQFYTESNANVHRGVYKLSETSTQMFEKAREKVAKFINANFEEIIFTKGGTESINLLAYCFEDLLKKGDEIIVTEMEHHSNLIPWQELCKRKGLKLEVVKLNKDLTLDMNDLKEKVNNKTKIVAVTHCSNATGVINPIKEIVKIAHKCGSYVVVDGAQAIPHMKVDVKDLNVDFYIFSGHKMLAPTGIGVLFGKGKLLQMLRPFLYGGGIVREVSLERVTYVDIPTKFEAGTPNICGAIGLGIAIDYLNSIGMKNINSYLNDLTKYAVNKMRKIDGIEIIGHNSKEKSKESGPLISFLIEGMHPHDIATELDSRNIACRGGHHCCIPLMKILNVPGTTRVSFYIYNTKKDVDYLIKSLKEIISKFNNSGLKEEFKYEIGSDTGNEDEEIYKENILDHYKNPRNKGKIEKGINAINHRELNPLCGDDITIYLKLNKTKNSIKRKSSANEKHSKKDIYEIIDAKFEGHGCAISQASISMLTEKLKSMKVEDAHKLTHEDILKMLGIEIGVVRMKCALLSLKTLHNALSKIEKERSKK